MRNSLMFRGQQSSSTGGARLSSWTSGAPSKEPHPCLERHGGCQGAPRHPWILICKGGYELACVRPSMASANAGDSETAKDLYKTTQYVGASTIHAGLRM
ncbi:hypothetical protein MN608_09081 [Microdochium nivale]|nr:hypothetical protein MN608_09081 [Microdochium nivale]